MATCIVSHLSRYWLMVEQPKQSEISNVFGMDHPQHMWTKLAWELNDLMNSMYDWKNNKVAPEPLLF